MQDTDKHSNQTPVIMPTPKKTMDPTPTNRNLPCKLTGQELLVMGDKLATLNADAAALEEDKKRVNADFKARDESISADAGIIVRCIQTRIEYRSVPCLVIWDGPEKGIVSTMRTDTSEVFEQRPMTPSEMQMTLQFEEANKEKA
jgi:hypothetical protein